MFPTFLFYPPYYIFNVSEVNNAESELSLSLSHTHTKHSLNLTHRNTRVVRNSFLVVRWISAIWIAANELLGYLDVVSIKNTKTYI